AADSNRPDAGATGRAPGRLPASSGRVGGRQQLSQSPPSPSLHHPGRAAAGLSPWTGGRGDPGAVESGTPEGAARRAVALHLAGPLASLPLARGPAAGRLSPGPATSPSACSLRASSGVGGGVGRTQLLWTRAGTGDPLPLGGAGALPDGER